MGFNMRYGLTSTKNGLLEQNKPLTSLRAPEERAAPLEKIIGFCCGIEGRVDRCRGRPAAVTASTSGIGAIIQIAGYDRVISLAPEAVPRHAFFAHVEPTAIARLFVAVAAHVVPMRSKSRPFPIEWKDRPGIYPKTTFFFLLWCFSSWRNVCWCQ